MVWAVKTHRHRALVNFIQARERHRKTKETGKKPRAHLWDPIIAKYRFCNVRRNDDRVTKWILAAYVKKWRDEPDLWFALTVARLFNNEGTLADIAKHTLPFDPDKMLAALELRRAAGLKCFNAAYIVSTNGVAKDKLSYIVENLLGPLWQVREKIRPAMHGGSLAAAHVKLMAQPGLGSFMAAQVLADLKYAHPERWEDFDTFAASGPGSKRGLNRLLDLPVSNSWNETAFRSALTSLREQVNKTLKSSIGGPLTAQDLQNCLCEFDKYERARTGDGTPKQHYKPKEK